MPAAFQDGVRPTLPTRCVKGLLADVQWQATGQGKLFHRLLISTAPTRLLCAVYFAEICRNILFWWKRACTSCCPCWTRFGVLPDRNCHQKPPSSVRWKPKTDKGRVLGFWPPSYLYKRRRSAPVVAKYKSPSFKPSPRSIWLELVGSFPSNLFV